MQTSGRGRDRQQGQRGLVARQRLADEVRWWLADREVPHLCADKPGGTTGKQDRPSNLGFQCGEIKSQNLWLKKSVGVEEVGETPRFRGEFIGETYRVTECTQNHPPGNQDQKGLIHLGVVEEVTESWPRAEQAALFPLRPLPHLLYHNAAT